MTDVRDGIVSVAAKDGGGRVPALAEAPIALDDRIRCVDAVNDDGNSGTTGNDQDGPALGHRRGGGSDQNGQYQASTHCCGFRLLRTT